MSLKAPFQALSAIFKKLAATCGTAQLNGAIGENDERSCRGQLLR